MKRMVYLLALMAIIMVVLPGCGCRVIDFAKASFNQGQPLPDCYVCGQSHVRSMALYDQFETLAIFDALWVSHEVLDAYADLWALKNGWQGAERESFLQSQITEHEPWITFYLLSLYDVPMMCQPAMWSVLLEVDGRAF